MDDEVMSDERIEEFVPDEFVADAQVQRELGGITAMTIWRWDRDPEIAPPGWPPVIRIGPRKFRSRRMLEKFKAALLRRAIESRGKGKAA
jgi:hypothetical protein